MKMKKPKGAQKRWMSGMPPTKKNTPNSAIMKLKRSTGIMSR